MDNQGNIAMGYSAANGANPAVFPSVSYTGRLAGDPLGTLPQGEGTIIAGTGSQTSSFNRWGDYTSLSIDPTDDQTFWHVNEWVPTTSVSGWVIRVGSFKIATGAQTITLTARQRVKNGKNQVQLTWAPADGGSVNVLRNSVVIQTTADDGKTNDSLGTMTGTFTYQVCETDSGDCSNEVQVIFP